MLLINSRGRFHPSQFVLHDLKALITGKTLFKITSKRLPGYLVVLSGPNHDTYGNLQQMESRQGIRLLQSLHTDDKKIKLHHRYHQGHDYSSDKLRVEDELLVLQSQDSTLTDLQ